MNDDWTPLNEINAMGEVKIEPAIGDVWVDRKVLKALRSDGGRAIVTDVVPYAPKGEPAQPVTRVCIEHDTGRREWLDVRDLRKRFVFRRRP